MSAGTSDGVYRSSDRGSTFRRTNFPDERVQIWSFLAADTDGFGLGLADGDGTAEEKALVQLQVFRERAFKFLSISISGQKKIQAGADAFDMWFPYAKEHGLIDPNLDTNSLSPVQKSGPASIRVEPSGPLRFRDSSRALPFGVVGVLWPRQKRPKDEGDAHQ
jgi:hypothetical protein